MRLAHNEKGYASLCLKIYVEDMFFVLNTWHVQIQEHTPHHL